MKLFAILAIAACAAAQSSNTTSFTPPAIATYPLATGKGSQGKATSKSSGIVQIEDHGNGIVTIS